MTTGQKVWEWEAYLPVGRQGLVGPKGPAHDQHSSQELQKLYSCCCDGLWGEQTLAAQLDRTCRACCCSAAGQGKWQAGQPRTRYLRAGQNEFAQGRMIQARTRAPGRLKATS